MLQTVFVTRKYLWASWFTSCWWLHIAFIGLTFSARQKCVVCKMLTVWIHFSDRWQKNCRRRNGKTKWPAAIGARGRVQPTSIKISRDGYAAYLWIMWELSLRYYRNALLVPCWFRRLFRFVSIWHFIHLLTTVNGFVPSVSNRVSELWLPPTWAAFEEHHINLKLQTQHPNKKIKLFVARVDLQFGTSSNRFCSLLSRSLLFFLSSSSFVGSRVFNF